MSEFEIVIYTKPDGSQPVDDFIDSLDVKMQARVIRSIGLLKKFGYELREPYTKSLENGILELRIQQGNDISRILYFFMAGRQIILTNGFVKKTRKTPAGELALALKYKEDYLLRMKEG